MISQAFLFVWKLFTSVIFFYELKKRLYQKHVNTGEKTTDVKMKPFTRVIDNRFLPTVVRISGLNQFFFLSIYKT